MVLTELSMICGIAAPEEQISEEETIPTRKKRGRPKKRAPLIIPDEDLEIEADIESELLHGLQELEASYKIFSHGSMLVKLDSVTRGEKGKILYQPMQLMLMLKNPFESSSKLMVGSFLGVQLN